MNLADGSRRATIFRIPVSLFCIVMGSILTVAALGSGTPAGLLLAVPPSYLLWVLVSDLYVLARGSLQSSASYTRRPLYWASLGGSLIPFLAWVVWLLSRGRVP